MKPKFKPGDLVTWTIPTKGIRGATQDPEIGVVIDIGEGLYSNTITVKVHWLQLNDRISLNPSSIQHLSTYPQEDDNDV